MVTACGLQTDSEATSSTTSPTALQKRAPRLPRQHRNGPSTGNHDHDGRSRSANSRCRLRQAIQSRTRVDTGRPPFPVSAGPPRSTQQPASRCPTRTETEVSRNLVLSFGVDRGLATVNLSRSRSINSEALNNAGPSPRSFSPSRSSPRTRVVSVRSYFLSAANQSASTFRCSDRIANPDNQWHGPTTPSYSLASTLDHAVTSTTSVATTSVPQSTSVPIDSTTTSSLPATSVPESTTTSTTISDE